VLCQRPTRSTSSALTFDRSPRPSDLLEEEGMEERERKKKYKRIKKISKNIKILLKTVYINVDYTMLDG